VDQVELLRSEQAANLGPASVAEVLRWPLDAAARPALRAARRPCLWLLEHGELVPELDELEDWVRLPVDPSVLHTLVERLGAKVDEAGRLHPGEVRVDADGLLSFGPALVVVPETEARILNRLGESPEQVVHRRELIELLWCDDTRGPRAIDSRIHTLRVRVAPLGLHIHTIRGQGFLLALRSDPSTEPAASRDAPRSDPWST
jgi:DNA-binding winged helix-turn-helix (wHTH) protein